MDGYDPVPVGGAFPGGEWKVATFCGPNGGNCVEVNLGMRGHVGLRDSKPAAGPVLVFDDEGWETFLTVAKSGWLDRR
jgi:hypothetical protein